MPILQHRSLNILELQDCLYDDTINNLREELDDHISRNGPMTTHDYQEDEDGLIVDRMKVYDSDWAKRVTAKLLTEKSLWDAAAELRDYSWRAYHCTLASKFEVALSRYEDGNGYRWHTDHWVADAPREEQPLRVINFILFLTSGNGGELDVSTQAITDAFLEEYGFQGFVPTITFPPKAGDMVLFPSYYPHRVRPSVGVREVMHGHICL